VLSAKRPSEDLRFTPLEELTDWMLWADKVITY